LSDLWVSGFLGEKGKNDLLMSKKG
jgi:hypothetical protein